MLGVVPNDNDRTGYCIISFAETSFKEHTREDIALVINQIEQQIGREIGTHSSMQSLVNIQPEISETEFGSMAKSFLDYKPYIRALAWVPRVEHENPQSFVEWAQREIAPNFAIKEWQKSVGMKVRTRQQEYFPSTFIVPKKAAFRCVGLRPGLRVTS